MTSSALYLVYESGRVRLWQGDKGLLCDCLWPQDQEILLELFGKQQTKQVVFFLETAEQTLRWDPSPGTLSWFDCWRLHHTRQQFLKRSSLVWRLQSAWKGQGQTLSFGIGPDHTLKHLLTSLWKRKIQPIAFYSLTCEQAAYARHLIHKQVQNLEKFFLVVCPTSEWIGYFVFWNQKLFFSRVVRQNLEDLNLLRKEAEETATYVAKQRHIRQKIPVHIIEFPRRLNAGGIDLFIQCWHRGVVPVLGRLYGIRTPSWPQQMGQNFWAHLGCRWALMTLCILCLGWSGIGGVQRFRDRNHLALEINRQEQANQRVQRELASLPLTLDKTRAFLAPSAVCRLTQLSHHLASHYQALSLEWSRDHKREALTGVFYSTGQKDDLGARLETLWPRARIMVNALASDEWRVQVAW